MIKNIADFENENVIVCGDWNLILDTEKDCDNYLRINNPKARKVVLTLVEEFFFVLFCFLCMAFNEWRHKEIHMAKT